MASYGSLPSLSLREVLFRERTEPVSWLEAARLAFPGFSPQWHLSGRLHARAWASYSGGAASAFHRTSVLKGPVRLCLLWLILACRACRCKGGRCVLARIAEAGAGGGGRVAASAGSAGAYAAVASAGGQTSQRLRQRARMGDCAGCIGRIPHARRSRRDGCAIRPLRPAQLTRREKTSGAWEVERDLPRPRPRLASGREKRARVGT